MISPWFEEEGIGKDDQSGRDKQTIEGEIQWVRVTKRLKFVFGCFAFASQHFDKHTAILFKNWQIVSVWTILLGVLVWSEKKHRGIPIPERLIKELWRTSTAKFLRMGHWGYQSFYIKQGALDRTNMVLVQKKTAGGNFREEYLPGDHSGPHQGNAGWLLETQLAISSVSQWVSSVKKRWLHGKLSICCLCSFCNDFLYNAFVKFLLWSLAVRTNTALRSFQTSSNSWNLRRKCGRRMFIPSKKAGTV